MLKIPIFLSLLANCCPANNSIAILSCPPTHGEDENHCNHAHMMGSVDVAIDVFNEDSQAGVASSVDFDLTNQTNYISIYDVPTNISASISQTSEGYSVSITSNEIEGDYVLTVKVMPDNFLIDFYVHVKNGYKCISTSCIEDARELYYINHIASEEDLVLLGFTEEPVNFLPTKTPYLAKIAFDNYVHYGSTDYSSYCSFSSNNNDAIQISGYLRWQNKYNEWIPLKDNLLHVYTIDSSGYEDYSDPIYTDSSGCFEIELTDTFYNGKTIYLEAYSCTHAAEVHKRRGLYAARTAAMENVQFGDSIFWDLYIYPQNEGITAKGFEIAQAELLPYSYANEMELQYCNYLYEEENIFIPYRPMNTVRIEYPRWDDEIGATAYNVPSQKIIRLSKPYYQYWDVLNHEYGHCIDYTYGICEGSPGTSHMMREDMTTYVFPDGTSLGRSQGIALAYSEGVATYIGIASQLKYGDPSSQGGLPDYCYKSPRTDVSSLFFTIDYSSFRFGDNPNDVADYGEGCESSVTGLLLRLNDQSSITNDNVSLGDFEIWRSLRSATRSSIGSLIAYMQARYPTVSSDIGLILEEEGFSFRNAGTLIRDSTSNNNDGCWDFLWECESSAATIPNRFRLVFEGSTGGSLILPSNGFFDSYSHSLTQSEINAVLALSGNDIYWHIESYYFTNLMLLSSLYFSSDYIIHKPQAQRVYTNHTYSLQVSGTHSEWIYFKAPYSANFTFESSGSLDVMAGAFTRFVVDGTSPTGTFMGDDDDSGPGLNFSITLALSKDQEVYVAVNTYQGVSGSYGLSVSDDHSHSYTDHCLYFNASYHKRYCVCGAYSLQGHVPNMGLTHQVGRFTYAPCIHCGEDVKVDGGYIINP